MSFYAKESEVRSNYLDEAHLLLLVYKQSFLNTNDNNISFPSVFGSLLQEFGDVFPEEIPLARHPLGEVNIKMISFLEQQFLKKSVGFKWGDAHYRRFVKNFNTLAAPITKFIKKSVGFKWGDAQNNAFVKLISKDGGPISMDGAKGYGSACPNPRVRWAGSERPF